MMSGCGEKKVPVAVDLAPVRCPPLRPADTDPFKERPAQPPAGDLTASKMKAWIDTREVQFRATQQAGNRVATQYEACARPITASAGETK
jgi:hypothetical protein